MTLFEAGLLLSVAGLTAALFCALRTITCLIDAQRAGLKWMRAQEEINRELWNLHRATYLGVFRIALPEWPVQSTIPDAFLRAFEKGGKR